MRVCKMIIGLSLFFFLTATTPLRAQEKSPAEAQAACRNFVQGFYNWYVQKTQKADADQEGGFSLALKYKKEAFSDELFRLLNEDAEASAKNEGEIVGLDFDPFLNAQDIGERYVVGKVTPKGDRYRVEVFGIWAGKKNAKADVVPEVMLKEGRWLFVNFIYGDGEDENLLSVLKTLREERQKNPH